MTYFNSTHDIAESLAALARSLDSLPNVPLADVWVSVDFQVSANGHSTDAERIRAVDILAFAVLDTDADHHAKDRARYGTQYGQDVDGINVDIYTFDLASTAICHEAVAA